MSVSSVSSTTSSTATTSLDNYGISSTDFLTLLCTQLQYQDPLDPVETNEFMSQLAQLSQVELMQNIYDSINSLSSSLEADSLSQWSDIIGKCICVDGNSISTGDSVVLTPAGDYDNVVLTLTNSDGDVTTETLGSSDSLTLTYSGTDDMTVSAYALKDGEVVNCTVDVYQQVTSVKTADEGIVAVTRDGSEYDVGTITRIVN